MIEFFLKCFPVKHVQDLEKKKPKLEKDDGLNKKKRALLVVISWYHPDKVSKLLKSKLLKVSKSRKQFVVSQFFQKTNIFTHDIEFLSFFGRIEETIVCFQDCLTFI